MDRQLASPILADLAKKMVSVTGPRQVGKTYLARQLTAGFRNPQYLNLDVPGDARIIRERSWPLNADILVLDALHKMRGWKAYLKGVFDGRPEGQSILLTGSARMETFRQAGESLAGRYFHYRLFPFSVRELQGVLPPEEALDRLIRLGGGPEPFLSDSEQEALRWRKQYHTDLIREDVPEFGRITEIRAMRNLLELLRTRVGSPLSCASLAHDLQVSHPTVKKYIGILESLYIVFLVRPFHRNVARSILKEPKLYFFDTGLVRGGEGTRLENLCALSLLKQAAFLRDVTGRDVGLHYVRDKEGREVDFALSEDGVLQELIEIKVSDPEPSPGLLYFREKHFPQAQARQVVRNVPKDHQRGAVDVRRVSAWLAGLQA